MFGVEDIEELRTLVLQWVGALDLFLPGFVEVADAGSVELSKDSERQGRRTGSPDFQIRFFFTGLWKGRVS